MPLRILLLTALAAVLAACGPSGDPDVRVVGDVRAAVPVSGSSQVVLTLANDGDGPDELIAAETPAALGVEIHLTEIEDGRATMAELASAPLPPGEEVRFRPGGLHLMLVLPDETVVDGATFQLTLLFDRSEPISIPVEVVPLLDLADDAFDEEPPG